MGAWNTTGSTIEISCGNNAIYLAFHQEPHELITAPLSMKSYYFPIWFFAI